MNKNNTSSCLLRSVISVLAAVLSVSLSAQDLSHRKTGLSIKVQDTNGDPVASAVVDVQMKKHAFKFGSQIRDKFVAITEAEFNALSDIQKKNDYAYTLAGVGLVYQKRKQYNKDLNMKEK